MQLNMNIYKEIVIFFASIADSKLPGIKVFMVAYSIIFGITL